MATPFLGEIKLVSMPYAPKGWALCNGQTLPINQNQALFSLLGTAYGGDGRTTFALPDLRGRVPVHTDFAVFVPGAAGGEAAHVLSPQEMPAHQHPVSVVSGAATQTTAAGNVLAADPAGQAYAAAGDTVMAPQGLSLAGSGQPHPNLPPYLVVNAIIAITGIFPSRN